MGAKPSIWQETGALTPLVWVHAWTMAVVGLDLALVFHVSDASDPAIWPA